MHTLKYIFVFLTIISGKVLVAQTEKVQPSDSLTLHIDFISKFKYLIAEQNIAILDVSLTNKTSDTLYFIDNANNFQYNYLSNHHDFDIWRPDFAGAAIPVKVKLAPHDSIVEKITIRWLNSATKNLQLGFNYIKTNAQENISKKQYLLYKRDNILWSNMLELVK